MRSMRSAQRKVELRRLSNQLPVLDKADSLCKIVKFCVFCLFVKLRLSPGRVGPRDKDIPGYLNSGKIHVASRRCTKVQVVPPWRWKKILTPAFYAFSYADVDTYDQISHVLLNCGNVPPFCTNAEQNVIKSLNYARMMTANICHLLIHYTEIGWEKNIYEHRQMSNRSEMFHHSRRH